MTLDSLHRELVQHLLRDGLLIWPGGHTSLTVLDTWSGHSGFKYLVPDQGWRRVVTLNGSLVATRSIRVRSGQYGIGAKKHLEAHLGLGLCTHDEIRAVVRDALGREDLRDALVRYLSNTVSGIIVDEIFDANELDLRVVLLAAEAALPMTLIGDPWQALYEFRGARPELVPRLVEAEGFEPFPVSRSFRFVTQEAQSIADDLRAGKPVEVKVGVAQDVDVVLASQWELLWGGGDGILPLSFGTVDNLTDAAIIVLLDQLTLSHFGRNAIFAHEAMTLLGLNPQLVAAEGREKLSPVLEALRKETPEAAPTAMRVLRATLKALGSPRQLKRMKPDSEAAQLQRLEQLARRIRQPKVVRGLTVHQAKGQEWDKVGLRLTSMQLARLSEGLSEDRAEDRVLYVALTRARVNTVLV